MFCEDIRLFVAFAAGIGGYMINRRMQELGARRSVIRELFEYGKSKKSELGDEAVFDFSLGNPSVPAPRSINDGLIRLLTEESSVSLHGYTSAEGDMGVRRKIAEYVNEKYGENATYECVYMTVGAAAALTVTFGALVNEGEEVITIAPYFPEYKVFVEGAGGRLVSIPAKNGDFHLDLEKIEAAINEKTAAVLINSPNNPTGVIYTEDELSELADILLRKEKELGKVIYLISDEPYRELVYGDAEVPYVTRLYDNTIVCYSFSKSLSIPGERIGYILISPRMKDFGEVKAAICGAGRSLGFVCAPSLLQRLVASCIGKCADISIYDANRRLLLDALTEYGYEVVKPEGAFYLFIKSPSLDGKELSERAKNMNLLLVPSDDFGYNGYVRLSYCVETEMIKRSLPYFKKLIESYMDV